MNDTTENRDIVAEIADSLRPDRDNALRRLFNREGARTPEVIWSPAKIELRSPVIRDFFDICEAARGEDGELRDTALDVTDFGAAAEWLIVSEPVAGGDDYRFAYYGPGIAEHFGHDMSGRLLSEIGGHIMNFLAAVYRVAAERRASVYTEHEPPRSVFVRVWQRLLVPMTGPGGEVTRFLVMNVPENELRVGLELMVDPVLVLDRDRRIVFANRTARKVFRMARFRPGQDEFTGVTGIELGTATSPDEMLARDRVDDSVQLLVRDSIAERLVMTVSAAQHRGLAFYVVVMRLIGT